MEKTTLSHNKSYGVLYIATLSLMLISIFIMCGQIFLGFFWIFRNISAVPGFGDTLEYLELSSTFAPDEYRPILFPVILRIVQDSASRIGLPYQTLLYILQLAVSFAQSFPQSSTLQSIPEPVFGFWQAYSSPLICAVCQ